MQQDHRIWDHILIIESPLVRSRDLDRWIRDISMNDDFLVIFSRHDADSQAPTDGIDLDFATHANDTRVRQVGFSIYPAKSLIHKHFFIPESDRKGWKSSRTHNSK
jgi:hypothetical protein